MSLNARTINPEANAEPRAGRWWALAALVVSSLVIGLDSTVLITALPTLSAKLGATTSDLQRSPFDVVGGGLAVIGVSALV